MKYKICVYAICKNESAFVDRWMDSMSEADLIVVLDTGSTDDTFEKLRNRGALVYNENISPWRFDTARNISLQYVPSDVDICCCTDLDEVFNPGWRKKLEAAWKPSYTRAQYLFTSDYNEDKTPSKQFIKEKIHDRQGFQWVHPVHEVLEYSGTKKDQAVFVPGIVINHYPNLNKPRTQYLPLLELSAKENPSDSQTIFWLGREYLAYCKYDLSIATLKKYLKLPQSAWNEERSGAMGFIANAYWAKGEVSKAISWIFRAIAECPHVREPYVKAAKFAYAQSNWPLTYAMVQKGLNIITSTGSYLNEPQSWGDTLYDLGAISAYRLGMLSISREYAAQALALSPKDQRLENNLKLIEAEINKQGNKFA